MDKTQKTSLVVMSMVFTSLIVAGVTASPWRTNTPLYTVRMEQQSSQMNFLPTAVNRFAYTAEEGYTIECSVVQTCAGAKLLLTDDTCFGPTCWDSCGGTCEYTCWDTCDGPTCSSTCPITCSPTCSSTCPSTCSSTCPITCPITCADTCWQTCDDTCYGQTCWDTCQKPCPP